MTKTEILDAVEQEIWLRLEGMALKPQVWRNESIFSLFDALVAIDTLRKPLLAATAFGGNVPNWKHPE